MTQYNITPKLVRGKPKSNRHFKIIIVFLVFIALSLFGFFSPNFVRTVSYTFTKPLWSGSSAVGQVVSKVKNFFVSKNSLIEENTNLKQKLSDLESTRVSYDLLFQENEHLKTELGRTPPSRIIAGVLSRPPRSPYDTLVVDLGANDGVREGNTVYLSENIIIGTVASVTSHTSIVRLFSTAGEKQEATVSRTGASYELVGRGGANFTLEVPKDADILWGDTFMYSGISSSVIGTVYFIDTNSQSSFKTVYLRIPTNVFSSRFVFIEKSL